MSSANSRKNFPMTLGGLLILVLMAVAAVKSGHLPKFVDPYGFIFVLAGGVALLMVSFSGNEIRRALTHAVGKTGTGAEIRRSILFWEAAGRGFLILGALRTVLMVILGFEGMKTEESAGVQALIGAVTRSLLGTFYGILLAVICLIPCWKLMEKLQNRPSDSEGGMTEATPGSNYRVLIGYVLFFSVWILTIPNLSTSILWHMMPSIIYWPAFLVVVGGALALMLFIGGVKAGPPFSMSFASMGIIGFLMAFIQILLSIAAGRIGSVASAVVFVLSSCFAALLGMILVGAPLEDRAVRTGRVAAPSGFSRVAWYGFPLLTLMLVPLVIFIITTPLPRNRPQVTEITAPVQVQRARYEARAPQSDPVDFTRANIEKGYLIYRVNPAYPDQAKREGIQGSVKLTVIINEEGFVYEVRGNPENNPVLEKAAIPAVKRWRFMPLRIKEAPVAVKTTVTVNFALK